jgi:hypothetical protein
MAQTTTLPNIHVQTSELAVDRAVQRLREAIRQAGGQTAVSARSGIKMRSLSNYMTGLNDMKRQTVVTLADACGVTIEWLAAGRGPMRPSDSPAPPMPEPSSAPPSILDNLDFARMVEAMRFALDAYNRRGAPPDPDQLARTLLALYECLGLPPDSQQPEALARILTAPWVPERRRHTEQLYRDAAQTQPKDTPSDD